jgi:RNA polymerase sigma-70 factor (ECF subfamily)
VVKPKATWNPDWAALNGARFQDLCLDLLASDGYEPQDQGVGPDGGIDALLIQKLQLPDDSTTQIRWAAQFKYKVKSDATVKPSELGNISNLLDRFRADGFFLATNGRLTNKALLEMRGVANGRPDRYVSVWTRRHLESRLWERRDVAERYFPIPPQLLPEPTYSLLLTIDLPLDEFSVRQQRLLREALAKYFGIPISKVTLKNPSAGSTKVVVVLPPNVARQLRRAFGEGRLDLAPFGFKPAILGVGERSEATAFVMPKQLGVARRKSRAASRPDAIPPAVFEDLYKRYFGRVVRFFSRSGFSPDEALDLTQETFLRVFRAVESVRGDLSLNTWVLAVARNVAHAQFRAHRARKRPSTDVAIDDPFAPVKTGLPDTGPTPEERLVATEEEESQREHLRDAIADLPEDLRIYLLARFAGMKYREIAEVYGVTLEAVKSTLHEAQQRLRSQLGEGHRSLRR